MSTHPLVFQLRFARSEFMRGLEGVTDEDARRRFLPMNCISWTVGHLAEQENRYWNYLARGLKLLPELRELVGYGKPASTPPLEDMLAAWRTATTTADAFLDTLTPELLLKHFVANEKTVPESAGTLLLRNLYHYWYHLGEIQSIRQMLGHANLAQFVGEMSAAIYTPEK
jgi:hypothetical protein